MAQTESSDPSTKIRRRLASAMRLLADEMVSGDMNDEAFHEAADAIEGFTKSIEHAPRRKRSVGLMDYEGEVLFDYGRSMRDFSPICGRANPVAPGFRMSRHEEHAEGRINFSPAFEGPPGLVHGGYVSACFDELFGMVQTLTRDPNPAMTGTLTVKYRSPCPLQTDLQLKGWLDGSEGRKIFLKATMHAGERLIAEAEAIFLKVDMSMYEGFADTRNEGE